jgi:hypothetical protein
MAVPLAGASATVVLSRTRYVILEFIETAVKTVAMGAEILPDFGTIDSFAVFRPLPSLLSRALTLH